MFVVELDQLGDIEAFGTMPRTITASRAGKRRLFCHSVRNGKKFVRVLGPGDKPERREVTTGIADGIHIQILSGLKEGDAVITAQVTQQERDAQVQQRHRGPRL